MSANPIGPTVPNDIKNETVMRAWYQEMWSSVRDLTNERISVKDYGAAGDGVQDDTTAFVTALAVVNDQTKVLWIPQGNYKITSTITIANPVTIIGEGMSVSTIEPFLGEAGGDVFLITSSDVTMMDFGFDGTDAGTVTLTNNEFMIHVNPASGTLNRMFFNRLRFEEFDFKAGVKDVSTEADIRGAYCIKVEDTDRVIIEGCYVDNVSGGFVYTTGVNYIDISKNYVKDALLHPVCIHDTTNYFNIVHNVFYPANIDGVFLGGVIDVASASGTPCHHGNIESNFVVGGLTSTTPTYIAYGAVIRVLSSTDISINNNFLAGVRDGNLNSDSDFLDVYNIKIGTAGTSSSNDNGPCARINIIGNYILGTNDNTAFHQSGILIENDYQTSRVPAKDIKIIGNQMYTQQYGIGYLDRGITINGKSSGVQNVIIEDNTIFAASEVHVGQPDPKPVGRGTVSIISDDATGYCSQIFIGGNRIESSDTSGDLWESCIVIGQYTQDVFNTKPNYLKAYAYGVVTETGSGPNLWYLDNNFYESRGAPNLAFLFNVQPKSYHTNASGTTANRPTTSNTLVDYMTYFDTTLGTPIWYNGSAWVGAWGSADSIAETISDQVGTMVTGNTETGIAVTYQDADNTLDFAVSDITVAGDTGSTGITPGDTLTIAGGTNITTAMSGDTLTVNNDYTDEVIQDLVGAMTTGNTEIGITVEYQDADGTIDFTVADLTVAGDTGSTGMTPGDTLTVAGGTGIETAMSGDTLTITATGGGGGAPTDASYVTLGTNGTLSDERVLTAGEGIDITDAGAGSTITVSGEDATDSNKGIASFDATDFSVSSGAVTLQTERIQDIIGSMVTGNTETGITVTYQDADGTLDFEVTSGGGAWELISTATASNSATIDFTGLSNTYFAYHIVASGVLPVTNAVEFFCRVSIAGSFSSSALYSMSLQGTGSSTVAGRITSATQWELVDSGIFGTLPNTAGTETSYRIFLNNPSSTAVVKTFGYEVDFPASSTLAAFIRGSGFYQSTSAIDGIRFLMSSGNISTGIFKLYGLKAA